MIDLKMATHSINLEDQVAAKVEKRLKELNVGTHQVAQVQQATAISCEFCGGPYFSMYCFAYLQDV